MIDARISFVYEGGAVAVVVSPSRIGVESPTLRPTDTASPFPFPFTSADTEASTGVDVESVEEAGTGTGAVLGMGLGLVEGLQNRSGSRMANVR